MKLSKMEKARGIKTVRAKYSTATTMRTINNAKPLPFPFDRFPFGMRTTYLPGLARSQNFRSAQ
jgi:hypothetical protein